jgi:hypothetical protein
VRRKTVALLTTLLFCGAVRADLRIEYEGGGSATLSALAIGGGKIRVDNGSDSSVLFDPAAETIVFLDHRKRRFTRMGPQEMEAMQAAVRTAMAELEQAMADMPPEVRAQMQGMMGGMLGGKPPVSAAESKEHDTVDGIACRYYRIEALGRLVAEICLARFEDLPWLAREERETLHALKRMEERMMDVLREGPLASLASSPFSLEGFPLVQIDHSGGSPVRSTLARVSHATQPSALFEVPAGYAEEKLDLR